MTLNKTGYFRYTKPIYVDIPECDPRHREYRAFKHANGFSPDECWDLATVLAEFLLPRLEYFRAHLDSYPPDLKSVDEWGRVLDEIIWGMRERLEERNLPDVVKDQAAYLAYMDRFNAANALFGKYWQHLWS